MNHDETELEETLRALLQEHPQPDPTPSWKRSILKKATPVSLLPPRWLLVGWAAAWMVIVSLHWMQLDHSKPALASRPASLPPVTLLTYHTQLRNELELP